MEIYIGTPNERQKEFLRCEKKYIAFGGARGGGKSWAVRCKAKLLALRYPGIRLLLVRRTLPEIEANHLTFLRQELAETREQLAHLEEEQLLRLAEEHRGERDVVLVRGALRDDGVRRLCDALTRTACGRCAVFAGTEGSYQYALIHPGQDIRAMVKELNQALHGRGGGRDGFAQGSAACTEAEIRAFFREKTPEA